MIGAAPYLWLLLSEERPVGLMIGMGNGEIIEPLAAWFPWATPRNKLECTANFLSRLRAMYLLLIRVGEKHVRFMNTMGRLGLTRTIGVMEHHGSRITWFQTKDII